MRLREEAKQVIIDAVKSVDPDAEVYLFGSRVNDNLRGGDIDLLVFSRKMTYRDKLNVKKKIFLALGEQKVDLLIYKDTTEPFVRMALEQGVQLI